MQGKVFTLVPMFMLGALGLSAPALAGAPVWTMSEASEGVLVMHGGVTTAGRRGVKLVAGDMVSTGGNARAVLVRGEEYAIVAPGSRLQVADPAASGGMVQFLEKVGNVVFSIKKMATPHFGVQTPYLAAVVKGTTFSVTVGDTGASVQVVEGAVEVATRDGGARQLLQPGAVASVGAADLGMMTISGTTSKVLHSNIAPSTGAPVKTENAGEAKAHGEAKSQSTVVAPAASAAASVATTVNAGHVEEAPASLSQLSDGMVTGSANSSAAAASASASSASLSAAAATSGTGRGNGSTNAAANSNAGGNSGTNATTGNGNSGNSGSNGNSGNSSSNSGSNGNSGNSSGNSGSNGNSGNSSSNSSSNGNGSSGSAVSGSHGRGPSR